MIQELSPFASVLCLIFFSPLLGTEALDCIGLPSNINALFMNQAVTEVGEGATITIQDGPVYTCMAQGNTEGTYRELAAVMTFSVAGSPNLRVVHFELDCISPGADWNTMSGVSLNSLTDLNSLEQRTNCSVCTVNPDNATSCVDCDPACDFGLMRCTGSTSSDCCVAFNNNGQCEGDFDFQCDGDPCENNGTCIGLFNGYICNCIDGFTDKNCTTNIDDCESSPCENGGTCIDEVADYTCVCVNGFTDKNCSTNIDDCALSPCENDGTCIDEIADYTCVCVNGFTDKNCSTNIDDCVDNPCVVGATCVDLVADYSCICPVGYTGRNCDIQINECPNICGTGTSPGERMFDLHLCLFNCNLQLWRSTIIETGIIPNLPELDQITDDQVSDDERYSHALAQQELFFNLWNNALQNMEIPVSFDERNGNIENPIIDWDSRITEHQASLESWRDYTQSLVEQDVSFQTILPRSISEESSEEDLSAVYNSYNEVWSGDLNTYISVFSEDK